MSADEVDTAYWRERLERALRALEEQSASTREDRAPVQLDQQTFGRLARMDAMQRREMAAASERRRQVEVMRLRDALKRLDDDEFGWCAQCGERIADARLQVDPATRLCIDCASRGG